jgi:catechol 2,3-dioxygenase-like lactoylglutathione lyase family enzyme
MHVNLNCTDLDRSLRFFRELAGLEPLVHTNPVPQDGAGLGLEGEVQWDARILHDRRGFEGPALDLLQWTAPGPVGRPYPEPNHLGMFRLCLLVPDLDAVYRRARSAGVPCLSAPLLVPVDPQQGLEVRVFLCRDPDGTTIEFVEQPGDPRLIHVNVNCSDLSRSCEWYQRVLGLEVRGGSRPGPVSGEAFGLPGEVEWDARFLWPPGQDAFAIDLLQWMRPAPVGSPYPSANHLGLYRMAFLVEDIRVCHEELRRLGVACGPPAWLDMGPEVPIDGLWALVFPDPDGTCLELIESPVVTAAASG